MLAEPGGWIAQEIGDGAMFLILGRFALGSILKPARARWPDMDRPRAARLAAT
jgi:hypothetical protein